MYCHTKDLGDPIRVTAGLFYLFYILLCLSTAGLLIFLAGNPALYLPDTAAKQSLYHTDIQDLRTLAFNSSADLLPLMQELLDYSGTIAVTLRKEDIESAQQDLAAYTSRYYDLQNLIVRLDMNESEVAEFSRDAGRQKDLLSQFVSTSESLQNLEKLEIQYQDEQDPARVTKVRLQGNALKNKVQDLQNRYADVTDTITERGNALGVNTQPVLLSRSELDRTVGIVAERQSERDRKTRFADTTSPHISFISGPEDLTFQDTIDIFGFIAGRQDAEREVFIYLDSAPVLRIIPDEIGEFRASHQVRNISAGEHILVATWGSIFSEPSKLVVHPRDTTLTLRVQPVKGIAAVNLSGVLTAREQAPRVQVSINVQGRVHETVMTDAEGTYKAYLPLPAGVWSIYAAFDNPAFPLNSSESSRYTIHSDGYSIVSVTSEKPASSIPPWLLIIPAAGLLLVPLWYLRRKGILFGSDELSPEPEIPEEVFFSGRDILPEDKKEKDPGNHADVPEETGLSPDAIAHRLYLQMVSLLSVRTATPLPRSKTPRELNAEVADDACRDRFLAFISLYERIRYGGEHAITVQKNLKDAAADLEKTCREKA